MGLLDILNQYAGQAKAQPGTEAHFDEAASQATPGALGGALSSMFRSDATPAFGNQIGALFDKSNPQQRAGALNQILQSVGPSVLGAAGGVLGRILGTGGAQGSATPSITPDQASQLSPAQVQDIATHAESHDPTIVDRMGSFYAQHPTLVKSLGATALAVVLGQMHRQN